MNKKIFVFCLLFGMISALPSHARTHHHRKQPKVTAAQKKTFLIQDISKLNLKAFDIPKDYSLKKDKSGLTFDALKYTDGDKKTAKILGEEGWQVSNEIYYQLTDKVGDETNNIYSALSLYKTLDSMECRLEEAKKAFKKDKGEEIANAKKFGQNSFLVLAHMKDPKWGKIPLYELRFYYGNIFANLEIGGPEGTLSQDQIEKYGALMEDRLKKACPNCNQAPTLCNRKLK